jgi:hypothetical protein
MGPIRWHLLAGALAVAATIALPWLSANRTARVEDRASELLDALLQACQGAGRHESPDAEHAYARTVALAAARGVLVTDLERVDGTSTDVCLANKHYLFRIAPTPADPAQRHAADAVPALAGLAWPLDLASAGHAMFFAAEDASRAYTRNLAQAHHGRDRRQPPEGTGRRRPGSAFDLPYAYRSQGEDRWILY